MSKLGKEWSDAYYGSLDMVGDEVAPAVELFYGANAGIFFVWFVAAAGWVAGGNYMKKEVVLWGLVSGGMGAVSATLLTCGWLRQRKIRRERKLADDLLVLLQSPGFREQEEFPVDDEVVPRVRVLWALAHPYTPLGRKLIQQYKQHLAEN